MPSAPHANDRIDLHQARIQQKIVSKVSSSPLVLKGDVQGLARLIAHEVACSMEIERVSVWLFNEQKDKLVCISLYLLSQDRYESGAILSQAMFTAEFMALSNAKYVDASDPYTDPRTCGYIEDYLKPNGITSMLDAVVRIGEELIGIVCLEHVNRPHTWDNSEITFSNQLGDQMALAVSIQRSLLIHEQLLLCDAQLRDINEQLERRVQERTAALDAAREALIESEKLAALGAIVAGVAHELNTPIGNARLVATTLADNARRMEHACSTGTVTKSALATFLQAQLNGADILDTSLQNAANLIASFKNVAVDQSNGMRRVFNLNEVVHDNLETMAPALRRHRCPIEVINSVDPDICMESNPGAIGQVLVNFITNAMLHAFDHCERGQILIRGKHVDPDYIELAFSDDGCGISPESLPNIFNPFYTTKLGKGGSGLGLHLVYNIVTQGLGGRICASSTQGQGATFLLMLPKACPAPATALIELPIFP